MSIKQVHAHRRAIIGVAILPLSLFLLQVPLRAEPAYQEKVEVRNVSLEIQEEIAIITYDLVAPFDGTYEVTATLRSDNDPSFKVRVTSATGDLGTGRYAGVKRQIKWSWKEDVPKNFAGGPEYHVIVEASRVSEGGGGSWLYYVLGGVVVAGGVVALVAGKKGGGGETSPLPSSPPGRPF